MNKPLVSICIPVYNSDVYEVVIINDGGSGCDTKGRDCRKIARQFSKQVKQKVKYLEHLNNTGLVETRREIVQNASGTYIVMADSDDIRPQNALSSLVNQLKICEYDIVNGSSQSYKQENGSIIPTDERKQNVFFGELYGEDIYKKTFVESKASTFLWAKLIKRELYLEAFNLIPYTTCNYCEDYLIYFFILRFAKSYKGIPDLVYHYRIDTGISSGNEIDLVRWEAYCNPSSSFTIIFAWYQNFKDRGIKPPISEEDFLAVRNFSYSYMESCVRHLYLTVKPEDRDTARQMLCEYWGEDFVISVENQLNFR